MKNHSMNLQKAMARKPIFGTVFIGIVLLLLGDFNHALTTESPAPQPQPPQTELPPTEPPPTQPSPTEPSPTEPSPTQPSPTEPYPIHPSPTQHPRTHPSPTQHSPDLPMNGGTPGSLRPEDCGPRCMGRCAKTAFKKPCMFFCRKCCAKCLCVPPGTYGNKHMCPCYNNWKTKRGGPKCP
ncbi:hypothetical protein ACET3Z_023583 [Daucus carota]